MPQTVVSDLLLCQCCGMLAANGDESSCLEYYGHEPHAMRAPAVDQLIAARQAIVVGDPFDGFDWPHGWRCDGCGQWSGPYAMGFTAHVLAGAGVVRATA